MAAEGGGYGGTTNPLQLLKLCSQITQLPLASRFKFSCLPLF